MKEEKTIEQALKDAAEQAGAKPEENENRCGRTGRRDSCF